MPTDAATTRNWARCDRRPVGPFRVPDIGPGQNPLDGKTRGMPPRKPAPVLGEQTGERSSGGEATKPKFKRCFHQQPGFARRLGNRPRFRLGTFAGAREEGAGPGEDLILGQIGNFTAVFLIGHDRGPQEADPGFPPVPMLSFFSRSHRGCFAGLHRWMDAIAGGHWPCFFGYFVHKRMRSIWFAFGPQERAAEVLYRLRSGHAIKNLRNRAQRSAGSVALYALHGQTARCVPH